MTSILSSAVPEEESPPADIAPDVTRIAPLTFEDEATRIVAGTSFTTPPAPEPATIFTPVKTAPPEVAPDATRIVPNAPVTAPPAAEPATIYTPVNLAPPEIAPDATRIVTNAPVTAPPAAEPATVFTPIPPAPPEIAANPTRLATDAAPPPPVRPAQVGTLAPGKLLGHTYEIEALLARGGMGEVYRARHAELGSLHAIKVILPELAEDARIITLFTEEARKLRRVRNDAVVAYEGLFRDENGTRYLVMEFVDGPSLAQVLRKGKLPVDEVRRLRDRCAMGLAAAHDKGIYHRDISPDNIILVGGQTEHSKIIDFGIAKSSDPGDRTVVGQDFAGKYSYVSPEQLGMYGGTVDGRSDIYSLGLVLAAAARGRAIDMGNSPVSVVQARQGVPDLGDLPPELRTEIAPLLEPDPARRPQGMRLLPGAAIDQPTAAPTSLGTMPPAPLPTAAPAKSRRGLAIGAGFAAFAIVVVGGYLALPILRGAPSTTPPGPRVDTPPAVPRTTPAAIEARLTPLLGGYDCANLSLTVGSDLKTTLHGFVSSAADLDRLRGTLATAAPDGVSTDGIATYVWPHCAVAKLLATSALGGGPAIIFNQTNAVYHDGQNLVLDLTIPAEREGYLTVDYYDSGGAVVHMYPTAAAGEGKVARSQHLSLGNDGKTAGSKEPTYTVGTPYGPNMIVALISAKPLFRKARPQQENAQTYVAALQERLNPDGIADRVSTFRFFDAKP